MSPTSGVLLLKAIRSLPDDEQEQLLISLLDRVVAAGADGVQPAAELGGPPGAEPPGRPVSRADRLHSLQLELTPRGLQPVGLPLAGLPHSMPEEQGLKVLPVRLPAGDYERLRTWSKQHDFSMAVIVRTLVERFLDSQGAPG